MRKDRLKAALFVQCVVRPQRWRCLTAVTMLLILSGMNSTSPVFAQFGGTVKDFEDRIGAPTKKEISCELDGIVPKIAGNEQKLAAMTRWEAKAGGSTLSVWTYKGVVHGINFVANTTEDNAKACIKMMMNKMNKSGEAQKPKTIAWTPAPDLMKPFAPVEEKDTTTLIRAIPPRIEQSDSLATLYSGLTGEMVEPGAVAQPKIVNKEAVQVDVFKTWRRVVSKGDQKLFVSVYDAHDLLVQTSDKEQVIMYKSSTVGSFMVMTMPLYLATNVRLGENLLSGKVTRSEYFDKVVKVRSNSNTDAFYAAQLREAVDHKDVPLEWLDLTYVKPNELQRILESELGRLSLTAKTRRVEALARQGVLSKLVAPVIAALKDKRTQAEALACLNATATKLKREPEEDLGFDFKKWDNWYKDAKKGVTPDSAKDDKNPPDTKSEKTKQ